MKPLKERLPLIDALIEHWRGNWKYENEESIKCVSGWDRLSPLEYFELTRDEFNERAKELGYINGYEYGVEYETNGEKPDLPDDVEVEWANHAQWVRADKVCNLEWGKSDPYCVPITKFRIVDERYKPKEKDMNDWYEKGELPPVGEVVVFMRSAGLGKGKITRTWFDGDEVEVISYKMVCGSLHPVCWNPKAEEASTIVKSCLRPLRTETDKLVEQMVESMSYADRGTRENAYAVAKLLIEQGYRKIKPMTEDEFTEKARTMTDVGLYRAGCRFLDGDSNE